MSSSSATRSRRVYEKKSEQFAGTVRALRRAANVTLTDLALRSGLSAATLSKIENGRLSPTYETLLRLADGLQVDIAELFAGKASEEKSTGRRSVTRQGQGRLLVTPQYQYELLCADLTRKKFSPFVATITARAVKDFSPLPRHRGEEFIYVLSGEIELHTEHYEPTRMRPGDGCYFDSSMEHACISVSKADAVVLWIASNPTAMSSSNRTEQDAAG